MARGSDNPFPSVLVVEGTTPTSPSAGNQRLFVDSADHLFKLVNSSGVVTVVGATAPSYTPTGLTGATAASRYVGATTSGAPGSGTFVTGDWVTDQTGKRWTCTAGGTSGTWAQEPGTGGGSSGALTLITRTSLGTTAASVTFSSIAGTYADLLLIWQARLNAATLSLGIQCNSDTGSNYNNEFAQTIGAGFHNDTNQTSARVGVVAGTDSALSTYAGAGRIYIPNYAGTTFRKQWVFESSRDDAGGLGCEAGAGVWTNAAAITDIKLFLQGSGSFVAGSVFTLFGVS